MNLKVVASRWDWLPLKPELGLFLSDITVILNLYLIQIALGLRKGNRLIIFTTVRTVRIVSSE